LHDDLEGAHKGSNEDLVSGVEGDKNLVGVNEYCDETEASHAR
jgi:hypothetical protein